MTRYHRREEYVALTHLTRKEAARELGVTPTAISKAAKRHGLSFKKSEHNASQHMHLLNADPKYNPLVALSDHERADYEVLKKNGYRRDEALVAIGRADLCRSGGDQ